MTKKAKALKAVETQSSIHACIELFETHFAAGSEKIYGLPKGAFWQPRHDVWGHFSESGMRSHPSKYWNVFGLHPSRLRQNIVVEINPPGAGKHAGRQGVVATDKDGDRWILHQGRLHPKGTRITEAMFDEVVQTPRWQVRYMDGSTLGCHPVANLDAHTDVALQQVAAFVRLCMRARVHHQVGPLQGEFLKNVETREGPSHPETAGSLTARGLLVSDTPKGPVRLGIPAEVTERWFPGLYQPEPPTPPRPAVARKDHEDDSLGFELSIEGAV